MADNGDALVEAILAGDVLEELWAEEILIALIANDDLDIQAEERLEAALAHELEMEMAKQEFFEHLEEVLLELGVMLIGLLALWVFFNIQVEAIPREDFGGLFLDEEAAVVELINRMLGP